MPMPAKLSKEQDLEVSKLYKEGMTHQELADYFSVGSHSIETSLKRTNTPGRRTGKRTKDVDFSKSNQILKDYQSLKSLSKLSKKYGSKYQLANFLRAKGVLQEKNSEIKVDDRLILELYNKGLTFNEITEQTGYSDWCLGKSLKRQGIDTLERRKNETEPYKIYLNAVRRFTKHSWKEHHDKVNPKGLKRGRMDYHIDHIYSVSEGFRNNIPPFIIGHWSNLQMLPYDKNVKKLTRCHKTKDQLFEDFNGAY